MTSHPDPSTKVSLTDLTDRKSRGEKLVMVTAYDHPGARLADAAGVDIILVGDSAADNVLGYDTTVPGHGRRAPRARPGRRPRNRAGARRR